MMPQAKRGPPIEVKRSKSEILARFICPGELAADMHCCDIESSRFEFYLGG
jgi:hypothetical protein